MKKNLRVLIVEDAEDDAILLLAELRRGDYDPTFVRVDTEEDFLRELKSKTWDIVISDFNLPRFSGLKALALLRSSGFDLPFILISGTVGEETAVQAMKSGAQDYIMKANFTRLVPAISRELAEYQRHREDLSKLRQKEEELRQSQKMEAIGQLAGGLAHDFNNILGVIGLLAERINSSPKDDKNVMARANEISAAQEKANKLVRQLLSFGRKQDSKPESLDLNQIIKNLETMLKMAIGKQNQLIFKLSQDQLFIFFDPGQLEQIILNLVVNARDALGKDGQLTIETFLEKNEVHLKVIDNGCGMDEPTRRRIFEPYFTTKPMGEGSGLGLSTVFGLISQHQGKIFVESELGKGSTFHIILRTPSNDERNYDTEN